MKDLIRFLKHEDDTCEVRRQLGSAQIVQNDLVPLVKHYSDDSVLLDVVIRYHPEDGVISCDNVG